MTFPPPHTCTYITGDPLKDGMFCKAPTYARDYCETHYRLCYTGTRFIKVEGV